MKRLYLTLFALVSYALTQAQTFFCHEINYKVTNALGFEVIVTNPQTF